MREGSETGKRNGLTGSARRASSATGTHWRPGGALAAAALLTLTLMALGGAGNVRAAGCPEILDVEKRTLAGTERLRLCEAYGGQVLLVVNVASRCGYTPQYEGLEAMYEKYRDEGFAVLGFPSNDFGGQEPGTEAQVAEFCRSTYGVRFPMFEKTLVAEGTGDAFYQALAREAGGYPRWNFYKYLIDRQGEVVAMFPSRVRPDDPELIEAVESLLARQGSE